MTARRRRILLTNDDGIDAPGMAAMRAALAERPGYDVLVVAPFRERSGSGWRPLADC
jgi:5'-nucleotidase